MIDFRTRVNMIAQEAEDVGDGSNFVRRCSWDTVLHATRPPNWAGPYERARASLDKAGRSVAFHWFRLRTDADFQQRTKQCRQLAEAGIVLMDSNAQAARLAG
jgi:hypothetical protein